ncbi:alpha/beta hydrolase family protein [Micromonospora sp. NPDC020750]|uniref:alpha/beta hydrolase family protein n=1 Tax=unclassified Micromonospora TaxID=2617518 RepID=UPI0037899418
MSILVVVGPAVVADPALLESLATAACAELGVPGRLVTAASAAEVRSLVTQTGSPVVALPGPDPEVRALIGDAPPHVVWYDLTVEPPVPGAAHLQGRGAWGLAWAVRHALHRHRSPATRIAYGPQADQWGELRLPPAVGAGPVPVVVLLHGGFWRSMWGADLMDALAVDLAGRGYASWNVEYRRPDRHDWDATTADVAAGVAALAGLADGGRLDLDRVVLLGHSAGGQLALRACADQAGGADRDLPGPPGVAATRVALAVSLAGVLDLAEGERRYLGDGAIPAALGGTPATVPQRYAAADPMARVPIGVPTLLVQGADDSPDLVDANRRYAVAARAAGDDVDHLELPGDHFAVIDPGSTVWRATMAAVERRLGRRA